MIKILNIQCLFLNRLDFLVVYPYGAFHKIKHRAYSSINSLLFSELILIFRNLALTVMVRTCTESVENNCCKKFKTAGEGKF